MNLKKVTNLNIYEIWNEHGACTVYMHNKPTKAELRMIVMKEQWGNGIIQNPDDADAFVRRWVDVSKLRIYTRHDESNKRGK